MARIKIESVLDHLEHDLSRALENAIRSEIPSASVDRRRLYKAFVKAAYRKCSSWERVPDQFVESE